LGQYLGTVDIVEDIYVANITMSNASDGARIKVWPGINSNFQPGLSGGGGTGRVKNITYVGMKNTKNDCESTRQIRTKLIMGIKLTG
jgi:galacturan 1,4-alpha-galacturonidase